MLRLVKNLCLSSLKTRQLSTTSSIMAKSRFEYVRQFEQPDTCLPNCWIVVRVDGKGFHKFSNKHKFEKPNDTRSLSLMSRAAEQVMSEFKDIILAYGQSDEYSFIFRKNTETYNRRASKLMSNVVALFSSSFVYYWRDHFGDDPLLYPPTFDSRAVLYPTDQNLRDYLSWRQADCHINNLYNTCFWALVNNAGLTNNDAQEKLKGTVSGEKHELLFSDFKINYNDLPELFRKGTVLIKEKNGNKPKRTDEEGATGEKSKKNPCTTMRLHCDIIGKTFWENHPELLGKPS